MPIRKLDLSLLLIDKKIKDMQENEPILVTGYGNIEVDKNFKEYLLRINFEDDYTLDLVQPETVRFFPLMSKIYKGKIVEKKGEIRELELNFKDFKETVQNSVSARDSG